MKPKLSEMIELSKTIEDAAMLAAAVGARGTKYAAEFIRLGCRADSRMWEHSASRFGNVAVRLVADLNMEIPQSVEYMKDWAVYAARAMGLKAETRYGEISRPSLNLIETRFFEHIAVGVAVGVPATGPFGAVLPEGVKRGWIERNAAVALAFTALEAAVRPGDRKVWLGVLDLLDIRDDELAGRTQLLIPLLSSGDNVVAGRLAPVLIAWADDALLTEVIIAALSADTKKSRRMVLKSAQKRKPPADAEDLTPWLSILAGDADKSVSALALKLSEMWGLSVETPPEESAQIRGLWRATPPVWQVPPFEPGEASAEALTELAAEMMRRRAQIHDITTERFLAMANAVAYQNADDARISLRGLRPGDSTLLYNIICWVKGEKPVVGHDKEHKPIYDLGDKYHPPLRGRDYHVCLRLGALPCILSTPSKADLSVTVPDLAARLALYARAGTDAVEADLLLALTRLDAKTATPESLDALRRFNVKVMLQSGKKMPVTAGKAAVHYLEHPPAQPPVSGHNSAYWYKIGIDISAALPHFPNRFHDYVIEPYSIFPLWGDVTLGAVKWNYYEVDHEQGLVLRQVARRAMPLSPGVSMNLLASQRSMSPDAAEDCMRAVTEAWERGLLRPGVADVSLTDWSAGPASNLAALAAVLDGCAQDGLLSVIWPIADALIETSLNAPRLLVGTAELAELIAAYLPEVQHAVEQGAADTEVLALAGIRALAQRGGTSRAVAAAKRAIDELPAVSAPAPKITKELTPSFDEVWREHKNPPPIADGVTMTVDLFHLTATTKGLLFKLTLPDVPDRVFHVVKTWYYDLENEGQCQAYIAAPDAASFSRENTVWLYWDENKQRMMLSEHRNRVSSTNGPLRGIKAPPLSASLLTIVIGLLAQDGDAMYFAPRMLRDCIASGQIGADMARMAAQTLLQNPVISPAKLVRVLEKDADFLPVLYPVLTECVKSAGALAAATGKPPVWVNRILDIALRYAPYLSQAAKRGLIAPQDARWTGLPEVASSKGKSAAAEKAKELIEQLK